MPDIKISGIAASLALELTTLFETERTSDGQSSKNDITELINLIDTVIAGQVGSVFADIAARDLAAATLKSQEFVEVTDASADANITSGRAWYRFVTGTTFILLFSEESLRNAMATSIQNGVFNFALDTGSANAYAIAMTPSVTAYATGQIFFFQAADANTGASTLNVDTLGVKTITRRDGTALQADDITASSINIVSYDGTNFQLLVSAGGAGGIALTDIPYPVEFQIHSDDPVSSAAIFSGHIEVDTASEILNGRLSDANYETSLDDGDTYTTHADLTALDTWIDANITLPTTKFQIRAVGIYTGVGAAEVKFTYKIV